MTANNNPAHMATPAKANKNELEKDRKIPNELTLEARIKATGVLRRKWYGTE